MNHAERALELHHIPEPHYNCCQSTVIPFAESQGLDHETFYRAGAQFGSGMRRNSVCGAVTGGLMALGLLGADDQTAVEFQRRFQEETGFLECADHLKMAEERGEERKAYCDRLIAAAAALAEELMDLK